MTGPTVEIGFKHKVSFGTVGAKIEVGGKGEGYMDFAFENLIGFDPLSDKFLDTCH